MVKPGQSYKINMDLPQVANSQDFAAKRSTATNRYMQSNRDVEEESVDFGQLSIEASLYDN